jgi:hypothetical protein
MPWRPTFRFTTIEEMDGLAMALKRLRCARGFPVMDKISLSPLLQPKGFWLDKASLICLILLMLFVGFLTAKLVWSRLHRSSQMSSNELNRDLLSPRLEYAEIHNELLAEQIYHSGARGDRRDVQELLKAVEKAPGAHGLLEVQDIRKLTCPLLEAAHNCQVKRLQRRAELSESKGAWQQLVQNPDVLLDKQQVHGRLFDFATNLADEGAKDVWSACVFHGAPSAQRANAIAREGFASNLQATTGWFGEGPYSSLNADYALRYCWRSEFWNHPNNVGYLVVARACFVNVYPVTQADNFGDPMEPGLKGKPVGGYSALGSRGCDAHFACVRSYEPRDGEERVTYHACFPCEREEGTELVVSQEAQLLPQYIMKVRVRDNPTAVRKIRDAMRRRRACGDGCRPALNVCHVGHVSEEPPETSEDFSAGNPHCDHHLAPNVCCCQH